MYKTDDIVPSILVIDDSPETLQIVRFALRRTDYEVSTAVSGEEALDMIRDRGLPHLVICDLRMPRMDGFELCRQLSRWADVPVIMLTAVDEPDAIVEALDQYAEDYIVKPFVVDELLARVKRVLKRIGVFPYPRQMPVAVDGHLRVNFPQRQLFYEGTESVLTPTEARLLYMLLRQPGQTIPYDYLLRRMWPHEMVFEDRLHVFVHRLRNKMPSNGHQYIALERGAGYRFDPCLVVEAHAHF